jgi:glycosyltransferase involved in cell wall biosynthesis
MNVISCGAPYGVGGQGRHLAQLVEEARRTDPTVRYYAASTRPDDSGGRAVHSRLQRPVASYTPLRFSSGGKSWLAGELHDRAVARALEPGRRIAAFGGQALHTFRRARELGYEQLELVAVTCHVDYVAAQYRDAHALHPIERPWLSERLRRKCLAEYELADVIHVASDYVHRSFLEAEVPEERLRRHRLEVDPRFTPAGALDDGIFRIVYTGALTVAKGVPVLLDAFERLDDAATRLVLVGGWSSRGMRRHLERSIARDGRISVQPRDPLPYLRRADVYVHPSWQDGWALAAMEAMACGVPVIVTRDTGMKEQVHEGVNGWIVPTGDADAIFDRLVTLRSQRGARAMAAN